MGQVGTKAMPRQAWGAKEAAPDSEAGAEGKRPKYQHLNCGHWRGQLRGHRLWTLSVTWHRRMFPA